MSLRRSAFTLIELLIVIGIIAILAVVIVLVLNPAELLKQGRDANRLSDAATINSALNIVESQGVSSLGNPNTEYISIPDPSATSTAGDQCQGLGLPALPSPTVYHCAASSTYRDVNGTGWIPMNLTGLAINPPISQLPVDPVNQTSSGLYYTYETNGNQYELTSQLESQKYQGQEAADGGQYSDLYEQGNDLALLPQDYGSMAGGSITYSSVTIPVGLAPYYLAFDSSTDAIWVTNNSGGSVTKINDTTLATSTYAVGTGPYGIAFDSHTNTIWIANYNSGTVTVLNDTTYTSSTYSIGAEVESIAFDPHTNTVWVTCIGNADVTVFNDNNYTTSIYPMGSFGPLLGASFDSHTNTMWISDYAGGTVTVFNDTNYTTSTHSAGTEPTSIAFDSHTNTDWVVNYSAGIATQFNDANYTSNDYTVLAPQSTPAFYAMEPFGSAFAKIVGAIGIPIAYAKVQNPEGIAFDSHTNSLWVENNKSNTLTQLNDTTYASTTYTVGSTPWGILFDSHNNTIWVANTGSNTVTELVPSR